MKYLLQFIKKRKRMLAMVTLLLIGQVVGTLLVPFLIANIIDIGILKSDMNAIMRIGIQMLVVAFVTAAVSVWGSYLSADFAAIFGKDMREALFRKTQELSVKDFNTIGTSSMITRTTTDITNIQQTLVMGLQMIVPAPLTIITAIVMTALVKPSLTLIPIASIIVFGLAAFFVMKKAKFLSDTIQVRMDKINQVVRESIVGIRVIRAFNNSRYESNRSNGVFGEYASNMISLNRLFAVLNPLIWLVMGLAMAAIMWFGGFFVAGGSIAIGGITAVTEYTTITLSYLILATSTAVTLPKTFACLKRLSEILNIQLEITDIQTTTPTAHVQDKAKLIFDNVTFSYDGGDMPALRNISFRCNAGQTTAIIGGTGSGKSTLASLLLRLHDVDSGKILLDGIDIRTATQHDLREQIGYVPQKAFLFSGTITDNLHMGNKAATADEMRRAVRIAQAESFISSLPEKFEAPIDT
jgi:ATP-binding cassette subfamily B protein